MNKVILLEYADNLFVEFQAKADEESNGNGLGGINRVKNISKKAFEDFLDSTTAFLRVAGAKVKEGLQDAKIGEVTITLGVSLSVEGSFIIASSTAEANLSMSVTFKSE